jgi:hypothetical protein
MSKRVRYIISVRIPGLKDTRYYSLLAGVFVSWTPDRKSAEQLTLSDARKLVRYMQRRGGSGADSWRFGMIKVTP